MIAPGDILSFRLTLQNPKIKNIMAYKSDDVLPWKEKICEKWNFSPAINMTSNAIP